MNAHSISHLRLRPSSFVPDSGMLREIAAVRQDDPGLRRRWYQDDYFDLFVWTDPAGDVIAFQLSYERSGRERVLGWHRDRGYLHRQVDSGEAWPNANLTPLLVEGAGRFPKRRVIAEFDARSQALDQQLRTSVRERMAKYAPPARRRRI
jgi:hypothetical protein